jgi:hypothetical protein
VAPDTWRQAWVVDGRPVGSGAAALKFLAPYIFRVALSNNRIVGVQDDRVTFRYRDGKTKQIRTCTFHALTFIGRFLQHVLPKGFVKVRYYGRFRRRQRQLLTPLRQRLLVATPRPEATATGAPCPPAPTTPVALWCPVCGQPLQAVVLRPVRSRGPPAVALWIHQSAAVEAGAQLPARSPISVCGARRAARQRASTGGGAAPGPAAFLPWNRVRSERWRMSRNRLSGDCVAFRPTIPSTLHRANGSPRRPRSTRIMWRRRAT